MYVGYYPFGQLVPNRHKTDDSYRYGFQGQEKDDELKGEGNHNTAMYWEYDTRIGRRWNLDPVVKSWLSSYSVLSNSPIWKIDPDGDDDYFDSTGKFLRRDNKKTSNIIVVSNINNKKVETQLRDVVFTKSNAKTLANIGKYYAEKEGLPVKSLRNQNLSVGFSNDSKGRPDTGSLYNSGSVALIGGSDIMNHSEYYNTINIVVVNGTINPLINDFNNMTSTLTHEFSHKKIEGGDGFEHLQVYYDQITNPNFKNTTEDFKSTQYSNIESIINKGLYYNDKKLSKEDIQVIRDEAKRWKEKMEKVGVVFTKTNKKAKG
jgi:RHS repeat-associated protein